MLLAVRREEAYDLCCWRPGAWILAFMRSGCLLHEAGFQQQQQQQHTNHLPGEPVGGCPDPPATIMPGSGCPFHPAAGTHKPNTRRCCEVVPINIYIVCLIKMCPHFVDSLKICELKSYSCTGILPESQNLWKYSK